MRLAAVIVTALLLLVVPCSAYNEDDEGVVSFQRKFWSHEESLMIESKCLWDPECFVISDASCPGGYNVKGHYNMWNSRVKEELGDDVFEKYTACVVGTRLLCCKPLA